MPKTPTLTASEKRSDAINDLVDIASSSKQGVTTLMVSVREERSLATARFLPREQQPGVGDPGDRSAP